MILLKISNMNEFIYALPYIGRSYAFEFPGGFCVVASSWIDICVDDGNKLYEVGRRGEVLDTIIDAKNNFAGQPVDNDKLIYLYKIIMDTPIEQMWFIGPYDHVGSRHWNHLPRRPWL